MIKPGQEWGSPESGPPDLEVAGNDPALARAVSGAPAGVLIRFRPDATSDLAKAVGLDAVAEQGIAIPLDALVVDGLLTACNMVVLGVPPDRLGWTARRRGVIVAVDGKTAFDAAATTVVIASGQFLRGRDLVPRGHPGDGRAEVQVYAVRPSERTAVNARLATGTHVPHDRITQRAGRRIEVTATRPLPLELDGARIGATATLVVEVVPNAFRLLL